MFVYHSRHGPNRKISGYGTNFLQRPLIFELISRQVLFVANFFTGLALGLGMCLAPMYLGEIASAKLRGGMGFLIVTSINAGTLFMFAVAPHVSIQTMGYVCLILAILSGVSMWFAPESPYYLANVGRTDEAEAALEKLRGKPDVLEEFELIQASIREQKSKVGQAEAKITYKQLLSVVGNRKAICIQVLFAFVIQLGGCISVGFYGQLIIEGMKSGIPAHICMPVFSVTQLTCSILTTFVIDRVGRRPLIRIASIVSGFCSLIIGVYFYLMEYRGIDVSPYSVIPLCAIFVLMAAANSGIVPIQMVLMSEIFATEVKALANFLLGIVSGVMVTVSLVAYPTVTLTWGLGHSVAFFAFTAITWTCSTLILRILPETKGKTLIEIQKDLNA